MANCATISLSVKQRGYQLIYRQGYYAVDANLKPPTMDDFNQALKHGVEQVNDVVFSTHLSKDASHIVLDYSIDPASLNTVHLVGFVAFCIGSTGGRRWRVRRSEEHTSELQ